MLRTAFKLLKIPLADLSCCNGSTLHKKSLPGTSVLYKYLHITSNLSKAEDRKMMLASLPAKDEGTEGEKILDIDSAGMRHEMFPDEDAPNRLFNGIPFKEIPIINIRASPNNTIMSLTDYKGKSKILHSCGTEGFKNTRKGTNIAAQATAISLSTKALEQGYKTVRVRVRGIGPGRMSAIKGVQMAGITIVSITDNTRVTWNPLRPRKARRV